jgi:hypothetical protein
MNILIFKTFLETFDVLKCFKISQNCITKLLLFEMKASGMNKDLLKKFLKIVVNECFKWYYDPNEKILRD